MSHTVNQIVKKRKCPQLGAHHAECWQQLHLPRGKINGRYQKFANVQAKAQPSAKNVSPPRPPRRGGGTAEERGGRRSWGGGRGGEGREGREREGRDRGSEKERQVLVGGKGGGSEAPRDCHHPTSTCVWICHHCHPAAVAPSGVGATAGSNAAWPSVVCGGRGNGTAAAACMCAC